MQERCVKWMDGRLVGFGRSLSLSQRSINSAAAIPADVGAVKLNRQINVYAKSHLRQTQLHWFAALVTARWLPCFAQSNCCLQTCVPPAANLDVSNPAQ
jgi:hypothetical protein